MALVAGQKLRVSDLTGGTSGGTGGGGGGGSGTYSRMVADVTVNNTTTFVDSGLSISIVANAVYAFRAWLRYTSGNTPDIKFSLSMPTATTGFWSLAGSGRDAAPVLDTGVGAVFQAVDVATSLAVAGDATGVLPMIALAEGSFATTTDGTMKVRVAQKSANASNTILKTFSLLSVVRIDQ